MAPREYSEEHRRWASGKIVAIAQSILSSELSIIAGARQINGWRFDVGAERDPDFIFFVGLDSETDHLPIGEARKQWNPDVLRAKDREVARYEAQYREKAFEACRNLIRKYESNIA